MMYGVSQKSELKDFPYYLFQVYSFNSKYLAYLYLAVHVNCVHLLRIVQLKKCADMKS